MPRARTASPVRTTPPHPESVPARAIDAVPTDWLTEVGAGDVTVTIGTTWALLRDDGSPARDGDVLSCQPDGSLQTRPAGANGSFERAKVSGAWLVYRPYPQNPCFYVPLATDWPNQ